MSLSTLATIGQKQGDTLVWRVFAREGPEGPPIDLSGCEIEFSYAPEPSRTPSYSFFGGPEVEILAPVDGEIKVELSPEQTRAWGRTALWWFELTVTFPDGRRITLVDGRIQVRREVAHVAGTP